MRLVLLLFVSWIALSGQTPDFTALESVVKDELAAVKAPGAAIAVVQGDRVIFARGYGLANVETGAEVKPEMLFRLGSTTKMFTAATLVSLALEGKIGMDEPVGKVVSGLHPKVAALTPNQLLSHTAGLWDEAPMFGSHDDGALGSGIKAWTESRFFAEPGRIYSYSNPGYWLAGYVSEVVSGKPFADAVSARLYQPLGMKRSTFRPTFAMTYPLALGHEVKDGKPAIIRPLADNSSGWPAGSMFSSVEDLSRWMIAFLNGGVVDGKQALPAKLIEEMSTPRARVPNGRASYSYGLSIEEQRGLRVLSHGGSRAGYGSMMRMAPSRKTGVIVLVNSSGQSLPKSTDRAWEIALGLSPREPAVVGASDANPASDAGKELAACAGRYAAGPRTLEFQSKDGKLYTKSPSGEAIALTRIGPNQYRGSGVGEVVFVPGSNGGMEFVFLGGRSARKVN